MTKGCYSLLLLMLQQPWISDRSASLNIQLQFISIELVADPDILNFPLAECFPLSHVHLLVGGGQSHGPPKPVGAHGRISPFLDPPLYNAILSPLPKMYTRIVFN